MNILNENQEPSIEFFIFLKYNKIQKENVLSERDEALYKEFKIKWKRIATAFETNSDNAKSLFGGITTMFGYNRHYCSTCGTPIAGKYSKIGGRIACSDCFESNNVKGL